MTFVVAAELLVILALVVLVWLLDRAHTKERTERAGAYERTLQTMANRIQAPQHIPLASPEDFVMPELEEDDSNLVGTIAEPDDDATTPPAS